MKSKFKWFGIILVGVLLFGIPAAVYAENDQTTTEQMADEDNLVYGEQLGSTTEDLVYTPVNPCVIVDTRYGGEGFISAWETRNYKVYGNLGSQGGATCNSPVGYPSAVHLSITVVNPNGKGNLRVFPSGGSASAGGIQTTFANIGMNISNAGTTKVNYGSGNDIAVKASYSGCHVEIMVLGYYSRPEETLPERIRQSTTITVPAGDAVSGMATCPADYTMSGGNCNPGSCGLEMRDCWVGVSNPRSMGCEFYNNKSYTCIGYANAVCIRIPGR